MTLMLKYGMLLLLPLILACTSRHNVVQILPISEANIINETGYGKAMNWFDEQDTNNMPVSHWETPGLSSFWPAGVVLDLGQSHYLKVIKIFDAFPSDTNISGELEHNGGRIIISSGVPFNLKKNTEYLLRNNNTWVTIELNIETRYLQVLKESTKQYYWKEYGPFECDVNINEVVIEGYPTEKKESEQVQQSPAGSLEQLTFDQYIGANSYMWIPDTIAEAVGFIREYHPWKWNGVTNLSDSLDWNNHSELGSFDEFYLRTSDYNKFEVCVDIHRHVDEERFGESKPAFGGDPADPQSYKIIADYLFQYAARYGNTKVSDSLLRVKTGSPKISGSGWLSYYENWNEPDRWWGDSEAHFTPYELAAMTSATYDGHFGELGSSFGVKQADKSSKLVLGGLTTIELDYIKAMKYWSDYYRGGEFPADVINFHHYNNTAGVQRADEKVYGISPEADHFREKLEKLSQWRDQNLSNTELWLSEFGWDTDENSIQSATGHSLYPEQITMEELQAIWLVRGYLIGAAAGFDRVMMFLINDLEGSGTFNNCGLIDREGNKKLSWYYTASLKHILRNCTYTCDIESNHTTIRIYKFNSTSGDREVYAIWCPTDDGTQVEDFTFPIDANDRQVAKIKLIDKSATGQREILVLSNENHISVDASETPVFIEIKN